MIVRRGSVVVVVVMVFFLNVDFFLEATGPILADRMGKIRDLFSFKFQN